MKNKKKETSIMIDILFSIVSVTLFSLIFLSIFLQINTYRISLNWEKVQIVSSEEYTEEYIRSSKDTGNYIEKNYNYTITYKMYNKIEELSFVSYKRIADIDIRINPNTNNIYLRREIGFRDYKIRLFGVSLIACILIIVIQSIIKKAKIKYL